LAAALEKLPKNTDPRLLVGINTADDAGVIKINDELALVQTVDIFTPIVDEPYRYGQIAAANSLSDIYAMGGTPFSALNIIGFPKDLFPIEVMAEVLQGGFDKAAEAETLIVGGHSISDEEMKYGLAVSGFVHPQKIIRNVGARPGDLLFLTKPIGTGTITTALKAGKGSEELETTVCEIMSQLNREAAEVCLRVGVHACTDISGFGLAGHAWEMAQGSGVAVNFIYSEIPVIEGAVETTKRGFIPGGTKSNQLFIGSDAIFADHLGSVEQYILFDAQTSGGLLVAVEEKKSVQFAREMQNEGIDAPIVGEIIEGPAGKIFVK